MESKKPTPKFDTGKKVVAKKALVGTATINDIFTKQLVPLDWTYSERGKSILVYSKADMSAKCMMRIHYVGTAKIDGFTLNYVSPDCKSWLMSVPKVPQEETLLRNFVVKLRKKAEDEAAKAALDNTMDTVSVIANAAAKAAIEAVNAAPSLELDISATPPKRRTGRAYALQTWMVCDVMVVHLHKAVSNNWKMALAHDCMEDVSTIMEAFRRFGFDKPMTKNELGEFIEDMFYRDYTIPDVSKDHLKACRAAIKDLVYQINRLYNIDLTDYINRNIERIVDEIIEKAVEVEW